MEYLILFLLGLSFGSFATTIIHRLHTEEKGILWGRSKCPQCDTQLKPRDLVPVFSFLVNKLKCRFCKDPISLRYPLTELTMATGFLATGCWIGMENLPALLFYLFIAFIFVLLTFYDIFFQEVPDQISLPTILISAAAVLTLHIHSWQSMLIGITIPVLFFGTLFFVSQGRWLGGGDVRIGAIMGALLGWPHILIGLFLGYLLGAIFSLIGMLTKKLTRKSHIPFAPFLLAGTAIGMVWGTEIMKWYLNLA